MFVILVLPLITRWIMVNIYLVIGGLVSSNSKEWLLSDPMYLEICMRHWFIHISLVSSIFAILSLQIYMIQSSIGARIFRMLVLSPSWKRRKQILSQNSFVIFTSNLWSVGFGVTSRFIQSDLCHHIPGISGKLVVCRTARITRSSLGIVLEHGFHAQHGSTGMRSLNSFGPAVWNSLPVDLRAISKYDSFKRSFKKYYFRQCYL